MIARRLAGVVAALLASAGVAAAPPAGQIARGEYLARAADCVACHQTAGGAPYAGGNAFRTPFGTIHSPNITPDRATGIGGWSDAEFLRALRQGIGRRGEQLYPAFPYPRYTGLSDADALAIKAYLFSLPAVRQTAPRNEMKFPYGIRALMRGWKLLNFREGRFAPDPARSAAYNRGRYLAETLGHCTECHTPRTLTMGLDPRRHLGGGVVDAWQAFNITPDPVSGIGGWSARDLATYLSTGRLGDRAQAAGPMGAVIANSTRFLTRDDLAALVTYLKAQPPVRDAGAVRPRTAFGRADPDRLSLSAPRGSGAEPDGRAIYAAACAACHGLDGRGLPGRVTGGFPALVGNGVVGARSPDNLVLAILHGVGRDGPAGTAYMPAFGADSPLSNALSDAEVARLASYIVGQFGDPSVGAVTAERVASLRTGDVAGWTLVGVVNAGMAGLVVVLALLAAWLLRRRPAA